MGIQQQKSKVSICISKFIAKSQFHHMKLPFYDAQIPFPKTPQPLLIGGWEDIRSNRVFHQSQPALRFIVTENEKLAGEEEDSGFENKSALNTPMHNAGAAACLYVLMICSAQNETSTRKHSLSEISTVCLCERRRREHALNKNSYLDQQT